MKTHTKILTSLVLMTMALHPLASVAQGNQEPPKPTSDAEKIAAGAAKQAARIAVGAAVGGTAGKIIAGSPGGVAVGILLSPSVIGCGQGETCRKK